MSFVDTQADFAYPWYIRLLFWRQRRRYGRELGPVRLWARMPAAFLAMSAMYRALDRKSSPIEPALRSLVQVRISQINDCTFCVDLNSFLGLGRGTAESKLRELADFEDSPVFSEREKAALAYAEVEYDVLGETHVGMPYLWGGRTTLAELRAAVAEINAAVAAVAAPAEDETTATQPDVAASGAAESDAAAEPGVAQRPLVLA